MKNLYLPLLCALLVLLHAKAQVLPDSLKVDWSTAGYTGTIPKPARIIYVKNFGAYGDNVHDDYGAITNAINSATGARVIYFPSGNYVIKTPLSLPDNVVLRGVGGAANLVFNLTGGNCINVTNPQTAAFTNIESGYTKGSSKLVLANTSGFVVNGMAEIREVNGSWDTQPSTSATYSVGQVVKVTAVTGNTVTIEPSLHINYTKSLQPQIRPIITKENVGIECLKISRVDPTLNTYGYNINFTYAHNCWVTGVESNKSKGAHIFLNTSCNITVSGSYFHDAFSYDGAGTRGYGVLMFAHNSDSKVENCIFRHLRHAMVAENGANGNVFAYNYSLEPYRTEFPTDAGGDMLLHGHYAFANLFEGNIGQTIMIDNTWGASGPYNTFLRNRAELYGIIVQASSTVSSDRQNIIGNEVTHSNFLSLKGQYSIAGKNEFTYGNNVNSVIKPGGTNNFADKSYYLQQQPYFWNITAPWAGIGIPNKLGSGTNPARQRYLNNGVLTTCLQDVSQGLIAGNLIKGHYKDGR
jgi:hypothetical protein